MSSPLPPLPEFDPAADRAIEPSMLPELAALEPIEEELTVEGERDDLERWLTLVSSIPSLSAYTSQFEQLDEYFLEQDLAGEELQLWRAIREVIMQRYTGVYDDILPLTDIILQDLFNFLVRHELLRTVKPRFSRKVIPLTFLGRSEDYYYTYTGDHLLPIAVVSIPQARLHSVWNWLAIPHEIGHHVMNHFPGYEDELKTALAESLGEVPVAFQHRSDSYEFDDARLLAHIWFFWLEEVIADLFGILYTGPAQVMARQEDAGWWHRADGLPIQGAILGPHQEGGGRHPASYVRSFFQCETLRYLGFAEWADRLEARWIARWGEHDTVEFYDDITMRDSGIAPIAVIDIQIVRAVYGALLPRVLGQPMLALGGHRLIDILQYDADDHERVQRLAHCLLGGVCTFGRKDRARHILAASRFAYELAPEKGALIHQSATAAIESCRQWLK